MPSRLKLPILSLNMNQVAGLVDPSDVDNLFSMWTIFSKCAESLENGRRLENLSWRLWNRETLCCDDDNIDESTNNPDPNTQHNQIPTTINLASSVEATTKSTETSSSSSTFDSESSQNQTNPPVTPGPADPATEKRTEFFADMPELSTSVESATSEDERQSEPSSPPASPRLVTERPCIIRTDSSERYRGREKHLTPVSLAKIMEDIDLSKSSTDEWISHRTASPPRSSPGGRSGSSAECQSPIQNSTISQSPQPTPEPTTSHSIVRGFSPSRISSSYRRCSSNAASRSSSLPQIAVPLSTRKKSKPVFIIGSSSSSSGEDDLENAYRNYKLEEGKRTAFNTKVSTRTVYDDGMMSDEDEDIMSESAIDEDEDPEEWESSSESIHSADAEADHSMFKRVESRPQILTSRRSLLSTMLHEPHRAVPQITAGPGQFQMALKFDEESSSQNGRQDPEIPGARPIVSKYSMQSSTLLSPRTNRRNMLATELTESLRKHLLWERKQKNTTAYAHLRRRHTTADVTKLLDFPQSRGCPSKNNSWSNIFEQGQYGYHAAGW